MQLLLVEDDQSISEGLVYLLKNEEYQVDVAASIALAEKYLSTREYHLIILDVFLPDGNGFDFYSEHKLDIPVIFLTARDDEDDIVRGFDLGAQDYITKPFSSRELLARVRRLLGRKNRLIRIQDITFDQDKLEAYREGEVIPLSSLERKILTLLFANLNHVVTRDRIIDKIWDWTGNDVDSHTVTVYLKRIREKLKTDIIITVKGIGYRIDG